MWYDVGGVHESLIKHFIICTQRPISATPLLEILDLPEIALYVYIMLTVMLHLIGRSDDFEVPGQSAVPSPATINSNINVAPTTTTAVAGMHSHGGHTHSPTEHARCDIGMTTNYAPLPEPCLNSSKTLVVGASGIENRNVDMLKCGASGAGSKVCMGTGTTCNRGFRRATRGGHAQRGMVKGAPRPTVFVEKHAD